MKRSMNSMILTAAATLTMGVSAAYAQQPLRADIPFSFHAGGKTLPPGQYRVGQSGVVTGTNIVTLSNTQESVMVMSNHAVYRSSSERIPVKMTFSCTDAKGCALAEIWDGSNVTAFSTPKISPADRERIATVRLTSPATGQ